MLLDKRTVQVHSMQVKKQRVILTPWRAFVGRMLLHNVPGVASNKSYPLPRFMFRSAHRRSCK